MNTTDIAGLGRWRVAGQPASEWLASHPDVDRARAMLIRLLDRPDQGGALSAALARYLGADIDELLAGHYPRKAAKLAAQCRARGDQPHAARLENALVRLMFCANCGRPLVDPASIDRGIGPDCWKIIDPSWRAKISARTAEE